jgi:hypothetical protein
MICSRIEVSDVSNHYFPSISAFGLLEFGLTGLNSDFSNVCTKVFGSMVLTRSEINFQINQ